MEYKYRAICHTKCYWKENLWEVGQVYEGDDPPGKHFSESGKIEKPLPPASAGTDPRSTKELISIIKKKHNVTVRLTKTTGRKQVWDRLRELDALAKDKEEVPDTPQSGPGSRGRRVKK